ncbi:MAG: SRPBCC domain-containing protein [Bacteroidota bacterium]
MFDGYASGRNLELIPNEYIRQSWRASDWPENCVSEISLELEKTHLGIRITFIHKNIPDKFYD